jgi:hypothetical protein
MNQKLDALYELLPAHIRAQDEKYEGPLQNLFAIIGRQAALLEQDFGMRMYDDCFIETCQDWVVAYIGDLLDYERMPSTSIDGRTASGRRLAKILSPRREIANLIPYRRRKGTLWLLEELARDVAQWPARAVEFYRLLACTEHLDHLQPQRLAFAEIRTARKLESVGTPFDAFCRTGDVRRISSCQSPGRHNILNVGLFVFRTRRYSVTQTVAYYQENSHGPCFTFSLLGNDTLLFRKQLPELEPTHLADESNFELPISREALAHSLAAGSTPNPPEPLYGEGKSLAVYARDWPKKGDGVASDRSLVAIPSERVIAANLRDWKYRVPANHVAVDPALGRIKFPQGREPQGDVFVSYGYGFTADIGGGEYERPSLPLPEKPDRCFVDPELAEDDPEQDWFNSIDAAYRYWKSLPPRDPDQNDQKSKCLSLVIELVRSGAYLGPLDFDLDAGEMVCLKASDRARPVIWRSDINPGTGESLTMRGREGSRIIFDGMIVVGRGVTISGSEREPEGTAKTDGPCEVIFRHTTLVPGWSLDCHCQPRHDTKASITLENSSARIRIESSIVGAIHIDTDATQFEPTQISVCDSIVDATSSELRAIGSSGDCAAYAELRIARSTIVGSIFVHAIRLAENSIFTSSVFVTRKQLGCMRFCFLSTEGARTPPRYHCQPDEALAHRAKELRRELDPEAPEDAKVIEEIERRVVPHFDSMRYGTPDYLRLRERTPGEVKAGADDESEMGVYHDLYEPQRLALLKRRLSDFVPATADSAVILAT